MTTWILHVASMAFLFLGFISCITFSKKDIAGTDGPQKVVNVAADHFTAANPNTKISVVPCTLSDGTQTECYQIVSNSVPTDHPMGPWCPEHISDDANAGGIWMKDGKVYDVDGDFIEHLATLYNDTTWQMHDDNGHVFVTETEADCIKAANPNVGEEYKNFCVECLPSYIGHVSRSYKIPITPLLIAKPAFFMERPGGKQRPLGPPDRPQRQEGPREEHSPPGPHGREGGGSQLPSTRGVALNGVEFSAPAPLNHILDAYTLAPFDDAGGHINVHQGYHYHAATGLSFSIGQNDEHAPLIGYAMDGHGIYAPSDENGNEPNNLDECRGHYDDIRGYHYHSDVAGNNNFINCLHGAYAN